MRAMNYGLVALALFLGAGCAGTGVNTAQVFPPQSQKIQLKVETNDTSITAVEFTVDDKIVGTDTNGSDGWMVEFDTTSKVDGIYTVRANGTSPAGPVELLHNSILIKNGITTAPTTAPTPGASASPTASPESGGEETPDAEASPEDETEE